MKQYDTFLFDWDGTLADSTHIWIDAVQTELARLELTASEQEIVKILGNLNKLVRLGVPAEKLAEVRINIREEALRRLPQAPLFADAIAMLTALSQSGKKLAVVTAMWRGNIDAMLQHHKLQNTFAVVISGSDVRELKPHPEGLLLALERLGVSPSERVLMAGDTDRDILAAQSAGVNSLLFYPPEHGIFHDLTELQKHRPTHFITNWKDFLKQL